MPSAVAIILAGGLGTRMKSATPKLLHELCGRPMLAYVLDAARAATGRDPVVVTSPHTAAIRERFTEGVIYALQERPDGSGDALRAGLAAVPPDAAEVVVLNGDVPLLEGPSSRHCSAPGATPGRSRPWSASRPGSPASWAG